MQNNRPMKLTGICILLALSFLISSPLTVKIVPSAGGSGFFALDVCGQAGPAVSLNADMPVIHEDTYTVILPESVRLHELLFFSSAFVIFSFRLERPPEA